MNKSLFLIVLFAFAGLASAATFKADTLAPMWSAWKNQHKKTYTADEEITRFGIFVENFNKIQRLNAESTTVEYAVNKFADLTATEFSQIHTSMTSKARPENTRTELPLRLRRTYSLPDSVDWRNRGGVTPVKDGGKCGAAWAFSSTGALEGFNFAETGQLLSFSEQQLLDCRPTAWSRCNDGGVVETLRETAYKGIYLESDYPYAGTDGNKCEVDESKQIRVNDGVLVVTRQSTSALKDALTRAPVSIELAADQDVFQFYKKGVIAAGCYSSPHNHYALAVGYQKVGVLEAFIVKNSWGTGWGIDGYAYISANEHENQGDGACGILVNPLIPFKGRH